MPSYEQVCYQVSEGVATITLDRPEALNAWTKRMADEFSDALQIAADATDVSAVVITGKGRAFCAGLDFGEKPSFDPSDRAEPSILPWQIDKPVIAAINGHAIGVGITLALTADIRFIADNAIVQFPFVQLGLVSELGSHVLLPRIAGQEVASDLLLSGRKVAGAEAAAMGLASASMPHDSVLDSAKAWASQVAEHTKPAAVASSKRILWHDVRSSLSEISPLEVTEMNRLARSAGLA